jgi:hypothetical protein
MDFRLNEWLEGLGFRFGEWLGATLWPLLLVACVVLAVYLWRRRHGLPPRP